MDEKKDAVAESNVQQQQRFVKCSINELRALYGLNPVDDEACDTKYLIERDLVISRNRV